MQFSVKDTLRLVKKRLWLTIIVMVYIPAMIIISIPKSQKIGERSDHWIFWQAGKDFCNHQDLYYRTEFRPYTYPPFAAFVFQPLHFIKLQVSANILFLLNTLILLPLSIYLIYRILINIKIKPKKAELTTILSVLFTLKYFWNNLIMFQINYIIFVIILIGIFYLTIRKPHISGILLTLVTMIKILPVFLVGYVFIYHFSRKVALGIIMTGLICLTLPIPFRGMDKMVNDYTTYYETFIKAYVIEGRVVTDPVNHSLKAGIFKTFYPETRIHTDVNISEYPVTTLILIISQILLLCIIILNGFILHKRKIYFSLAYVTSIILFTHLVSGITWTAHLVTLMFCLLPVILIDVKSLKIIAKIAFYIFIGLLIFLGIEGSDTVGKEVYLAISYYDIHTYLLLSLFFYCSWVIWSKNSLSVYPEGIEI